MTGLIPFCAVAIGDGSRIAKMPEFLERVNDFLRVRPEYAGAVDMAAGPHQVTIARARRHDRLPRVSSGSPTSRVPLPHGLRALSAVYRDRPFEFWLDGRVAATVDYEPAESTTPPVRRQLQLARADLVPRQLPRARGAAALRPPLGDEFTVEFPLGSGQQLTLAQIARDLSQRLVAIFLPGADGRRPVFGAGAPTPIPPGPTRSCSTSTSMATTAPASARRTRPDGPGWSPR